MAPLAPNCFEWPSFAVTLKRALQLSARAIIVVHNHPSGDPTPSLADIEVTKEIVDTGMRLSVQVGFKGRSAPAAAAIPFCDRSQELT